MKKSLKTRIKKWKIGDYVRQFSIVVGGVLLTLWLTGKITDSAKQREIKQAMQLVSLELRDNLYTIRAYEALCNEEMRIAKCLQQVHFSTEALHPDTISYYSQMVTSGLGRPYLFSTDALEMVKTSGLASQITDKEQVIDILRSYTQLGQFDRMMDLFFDMRKEALLAYDSSRLQADCTPNDFGEMTADPTFQNWLLKVTRAFNEQFFTSYRTKLEETISKLETAYQQ